MCQEGDKKSQTKSVICHNSVCKPPIQIQCYYCTDQPTFSSLVLLLLLFVTLDVDCDTLFAWPSSLLASVCLLFPSCFMLLDFQEQIHLGNPENPRQKTALAKKVFPTFLCRCTLYPDVLCSPGATSTTRTYQRPALVPVNTCTQQQVPAANTAAGRKSYSAQTRLFFPRASKQSIPQNNNGKQQKNNSDKNKQQTTKKTKSCFN